ncbi:branched-chain amino acid transport system II carrier protein [Clostridium colicanis]|jgi:LIVCS family branched-chain amino acid:cation transporter|uniref:Branched-chain amino acid transport system carrier protein n=1 Tax=Clostridium colicanis DSM 13634 TaxID=1121305 RepID=A0A151AND7_9CLOT|nr:branched-chain amino acid transport system II carrier protein [Clostridium colicanis]KYH29129.1 branched-chain amino acid transport system 2 carrier protein [Clostridium colicanis DSM 13634]
MSKSLNKNGDLKLAVLLSMGGALFSMHFGASSMVWPVNWGKESGTSVWAAFAGAFITALLLTLLGYVALSRGNGTYREIINRVLGNKLGLAYSIASIIVLGPLYAIPRMSAASWDSIVQAFGLNREAKLPLIIFTILFYIITYWFLMNPGKTMDRISSILFPFLIITVIIIVGKGIISPIGEPVAKTYKGSAFAYGFTNGYATAEILCALIFGVVILNSLKDKGVSQERMSKNVVRVGIVGIAMLSCTHLAHMLIGASTGGTIDLEYTALYTAIATKLIGKLGGKLFSIALFFAALTTAIGMTSGCAEFFVEVTDKKIDYKKASIAILIFSTLFGCMGLSSILTILGPILDGIYPAAIVLVLYYSLMPNNQSERHLNLCRYAMITSLIFGVYDSIYTYGIKLNINLGYLSTLYESLPLSSDKLAWVPWTAVAAIMGYLVFQKNKVVSDKNIKV